ncbi:putative Serine hydrolase FSH domain-containing protein [Seiridium cardinale]
MGHPRVLMLTNVEFGESNVFLATARALLQQNPSVELHIASFCSLESSVHSLRENLQNSMPEVVPIRFHQIAGLNMTEALQQHFINRGTALTGGYLPKSFSSDLNFSGTLRAIRDAIPILIPYSGPELEKVVSSIVAIIGEVEADQVVVDSLMTAALTACYHLDIKFTCLSPNSIKEFAASTQPWGAVFWRYPAVFSSFSYPVPWYRIPQNILYLLYAGYHFRTDSHRIEVESHLVQSAGMKLRTPIDLLRPPADLKILVSTWPELDFPAMKLPSHLYPCGPIVQESEPISKTNPDLDEWLSRNKTIYINLGSICRLDEDQSTEIALGLRNIYNSVSQDHGPRLQVLWKLKRYGNFETGTGSKIHDVLGQEIDNDLVRIVDWLQEQPSAILQSGHIACSIHHGGANSYNEAALAGIPQVILPQWTDCYDYGQRVEILGIGKLGNSPATARFTAKSISEAVRQVLFSEAATAIEQRAMDLADIVRSRGSGADNTAQVLLQDCK